jgi:prolyl-tRNA editing enzyme YbaK/EbsC (Cys-tRNA(Pro) deacylase)
MSRYLILCLFLSINSFACINEFDSNHLKTLSEAEEKKYAVEINHAVQLIRNKKYKEVIKAKNKEKLDIKPTIIQ